MPARHCSNHKHKPIRRPCKNCKHSPRINRKNPSAKNHHGRCSFKRYHKAYCRRHVCGCAKIHR